MKLNDVINELVEERDLDRAILADIVIEGILAAYQKKYPELELRASFNKKTDMLEVEVKKVVAAQARAEDMQQISLRKAKGIDSHAKLGGAIWALFQEPIGRVEILKARQVIAQKIRAVEAEAVYRAYKDKQGTVVQGTVYKCERAGTLVKLQEVMAFLPKSLMVPGGHCTPGHPIKALLKEVLLEPRNENQLILDRATPDFLRRLFELEIPEVFEGIVEIKDIVRDAGYKSKVLVVSHDMNIDPVGTCVGVGGARIKPILRELEGEKIDIIAASGSKEDLVKNALKPAEINRVEILGHIARVWLDDDQRSLAIGRMGKNIALASRLVGLDLELVESIAGRDVVISLDIDDDSTREKLEVDEDGGE